jgi:excisionase family DNA binding protein
VTRVKPELVEPHFTARELSATLGVNLETIRAARIDGALLSARVGYQRRYPDSAVRAWLELRALDAPA